MVIPGAMMRKAREKLLLGRRTALTVCQAMSMDMTMVLPAPVASLSAMRKSSGLAFLVRSGEVVEESLAALATLGRDFRKPDGRLNSLKLAEERAYGVEFVRAPVVEQTRRLGGDLPLAFRQLPPGIHEAAHLIDDGRGVIFLPIDSDLRLLSEEAARGVVLFLLASILRLGDRREVGALSAEWLDGVGGLPILVEIPMLTGVVVGCVENGFFEEVRHNLGQRALKDVVR